MNKKNHWHLAKHGRILAPHGDRAALYALPFGRGDVSPYAEHGGGLENVKETLKHAVIAIGSHDEYLRQARAASGRFKIAYGLGEV